MEPEIPQGWVMCVDEVIYDPRTPEGRHHRDLHIKIQDLRNELEKLTQKMRVSGNKEKEIHSDV